MHHSEEGCRKCGEKDWRVLKADHIAVMHELPYLKKPQDLTDRERKVFTVLTKGHALNINPYDGKNFFSDDRAFLQYKLCIAFAFDMRGEKGNLYRSQI